MSNVFNFENRLTEIWFTLSNAFRQLEQIDKLINQHQDDIVLYKKYRDLRKCIDNFQKELKKTKEAY